jgi:hypothetical protein
MKCGETAKNQEFDYEIHISWNSQTIGYNAELLYMSTYCTLSCIYCAVYRSSIPDDDLISGFVV